MDSWGSVFLAFLGTCAFAQSGAPVFSDVRNTICAKDDRLAKELKIPRSAFKIREKKNDAQGFVQEWVLRDPAQKSAHGLKGLLIRVQNNRVKTVLVFPKEKTGLEANLSLVGLTRADVREIKAGKDWVGETFDGKGFSVWDEGRSFGCGHGGYGE